MNSYVGKHFGAWVVFASGRNGRKTICHCECRCGTIKEVRADHLVSGASQSCGCIKSFAISKANSTHGKTKSPEYHSWSHAVDRCTNPKSKDYPSYGGRGILMCYEWALSFENFISDMGDRPTAKHSLDRIDVNGHYCKENCRWASAAQQARNKRKARTLTAFGVTKSIHDWAAESGVTASAIWARIIKGLPHELAVTTPKYQRRSESWGM